MPQLLDGAGDSAGALGALNRVYLNIGLFSEEWLEHFNALVGGKKVTPIEIAVAEKNSSYWQANESQTPDLARFMLVATDAHYLAKAPGGRCHSSKLPEMAPGEGLAKRLSRMGHPAGGVDPGRDTERHVARIRLVDQCKRF